MKSKYNDGYNQAIEDVIMKIRKDSKKALRSIKDVTWFDQLFHGPQIAVYEDVMSDIHKNADKLKELKK